MKKIIHLTNYISYTSGVTRYIYLLIKHTKQFFDHEIICFEGDAFELFRKDKIKITKLNCKGVKSFPGIFFYLNNYCKTNGVDIIHNHHRIFDTLTSLLPSKKIRTVTTVHSKVFGMKLLSYRADRIISVSDSITNHLTRYFNKSAQKVRRLKNFIDETELGIDIPAIELKKYFNLTDRKVILFAGRFSKEKGVDILIRAFKNLSNRCHNSALIMVGEGKEESELKKYSAENKLPVYFNVPVKNIFNFYNIADLVVLPSRVDPFPYVMLESGLMKKPFIGSKVDGIQELIKDNVNGILFEKECIDDLVNSVLLILRDESAGKKLANELHRIVMDNYTAEKVISDYIEFYNSLF